MSDMHLTFHVVYGNEGFNRTVRCSASKAGRILSHEFSRVERAGRGFVRLENHRPAPRGAFETTYEYTVRRGFLGWKTDERRLSVDPWGRLPPRSFFFDCL